MQNQFESELADADGLEAGDEFEDELDEGDMGEDPFEDALADEADDALEDDAFVDEDSLEDDAYEEDDTLEAEGLDDEGFEEESFDGGDEDEFDELDEADEFDEGDDSGDELDEAFADAMEAADDDEFAARLSSRLARIRRMAQPYLRQMARRAVPIGLRLIRHVARHSGPGASPHRLDAMDAFADAAADEALAGRSINAYIPFLAGLAGRYVTKAILRASGRRIRPGAARALGRAVTKATRKAARRLVKKRGAKALRSIPRIVRKVAGVARRRRGSVGAVPRMIQRAASRVASSPRAAARLSRPSAVVRRVRVRAGVMTGFGSGEGVPGTRRRRRRSTTELRRAV
jgi:hypothetical protein